jgi:hypothetical protein
MPSLKTALLRLVHLCRPYFITIWNFDFFDIVHIYIFKSVLFIPLYLHYCWLPTGAIGLRSFLCPFCVFAFSLRWAQTLE